MENALLPQIMENTQPPRVFFFNFPSNCACKAGLFFEFFALNNRVLYLSLLCFLTLGKRVHYRRNLTYNFKKKKLSGGESFEIFSQIAPIIQASFLTFFYFFCHVFIVYICVCFFNYLVCFYTKNAKKINFS